MRKPSIEVPEEVRRSVRESISSTSTFAIYTGRRIEFLPTDPEKGIETKGDSSYIDAFLFALFATTNAFDGIALSGMKPETKDKRVSFDQAPAQKKRKVSPSRKLIARFHEIRTLVRGTGCSAAKIKEFRDLLGHFNAKIVTNIVELDVVIDTLFSEAFRLDPFVTYTSGVKRFYHEVRVACQDSCPSPTGHHQAELQTVFQNSMIQRKLTFGKIPSPVLFLKVGRNCGETAGVVPNLSLDITEFLDTGADGDVLDQTRRTMHLLAIICRQRDTFSTFCRQGFDIESSWIYFSSHNPNTVVKLPHLGKQLESLRNNDPDQAWEPLCLKILSDIYMCIYACRDDFTGYSSIGFDEEDEDVMYSAPASAKMSARSSHSSGDNISTHSLSDSDLWQKCLEAEVHPEAVRKCFDKVIQEKACGPDVTIAVEDEIGYSEDDNGTTSPPPRLQIPAILVEGNAIIVPKSSNQGSHDNDSESEDEDEEAFPVANDILSACFPEILDLSPFPSPQVIRSRLSSIAECDAEVLSVRRMSFTEMVTNDMTRDRGEDDSSSNPDSP